MASKTDKNTGSDLRRILHTAYTFVRSMEANKAVASLTLDHLIDEQIQLLKPNTTRPILDSKGESLGNRVSEWDRIDQLEKELEMAIDLVKEAGDDPQKLKQIGIYEVDGAINVANASEEEAIRQQLVEELKKGSE